MPRRRPAQQPSTEHDSVQQAASPVQSQREFQQVRTQRARCLERDQRERRMCALLLCSHRHETDQSLAPSARNGSSVPSRFDSTFFRTHDAIGSIPSDARSVRSQATYSSGLPTFSQSGSSYPAGVKRGPSSYASSTFSQDLLGSHDSQSVRDDASSVAGGGVGGSSVAYSQADRLRRASMSLSDAVSDYKSQEGGWRDDDDRSTYTASQAGTTEY